MRGSLRPRRSTRTRSQTTRGHKGSSSLLLLFLQVFLVILLSCLIRLTASASGGQCRTANSFRREGDDSWRRSLRDPFVSLRDGTPAQSELLNAFARGIEFRAHAHYLGLRATGIANDVVDFHFE